MKTSIPYLFAFLLFGFVVSCGDTTTEEPTDEVTTEETTTEEETPAPEPAGTDRVTELNQLMAFVETNAAELMDVTEHKYTCEGWGGTVKFAMENDMLKLVEHLNGGEDGSEIKKYYYDQNNELVAIWHELSLWAGDNNETSQTTYYIENGAVIKTSQIKVKGTSETLEQNLAAAEATDAPSDGFGELLTAANELVALSGGEDIQSYFCN